MVKLTLEATPAEVALMAPRVRDFFLVCEESGDIPQKDPQRVRRIFNVEPQGSPFGPRTDAPIEGRKGGQR